ncbi:MAG: cellulase family glycosylhydrolase [Xanthobacteraceae bacterium]
MSAILYRSRIGLGGQVSEPPGRPARLAACAGACLLGCALISPSFAQEGPAFEVARKLGGGVNILGYDGVWEGGVDAPFRQRYFKLIHDVGFDHVRINLHAFKYMNSYNEIDERVLGRLDQVLQHVVDSGLVPVVDEHDFIICQRDPDDCGIKVLAFWRQLAARYAGRFPTAVFDLLNEPGGRMTQAWWNAFIPTVLRAVRDHDPHRTVVIAALNTDDPLQLRALRLPDRDRNIIVTIHYYRPMEFTLQGAVWSAKFAGLHDIDWGSQADQEQLLSDFEMTDAWAKANSRPVYLGEFGVYEGANMAARSRYTAFVARNAARLGWAWAYWQFDHDFALFDSAREQWVCPILDALIPHGCERRVRR